MNQYFPTDVSLRIKGSREDAQPLYGAARALLFTAISNREKQGVPVLALTRNFANGDSINVQLFGGIKNITITTARQPEVPVKKGS